MFESNDNTHKESITQDNKVTPRKKKASKPEAAYGVVASAEVKSAVSDAKAALLQADIAYEANKPIDLAKALKEVRTKLNDIEEMMSKLS